MQSRRQWLWMLTAVTFAFCFSTMASQSQAFIESTDTEGRLPMTQRAQMVRRVREILTTGGWTAVRVRQLYHDRDEVTLSAWRGFGGDARPPKKPRG